MDNFELPNNIKQIGAIGDGLRIYVEDYAATYIQQYTFAGGNNERLAMLVGRYLTIDGQPVLFISGAIEGKYCIEERGSLEFTDKTHEYVLDVMDRYFPSLEIVGWVQSQPGYGTYLGSRYYNYHLDNFKKDFQVLYVTDPIQKLSCFYIYNDENELVESQGHFIYYDKNRTMHEYMVSNKAEAVHTEDNESEETADFDEDKDAKNISQEKAKPRPITLRPVSRGTSEMDIKKRQLERKRRTTTDSKRLTNMLTGLCAVMFLACFVMGAGLIRSDDRINILEQNLAALNTAYRNIASSSDQTQPAFASDGSQNTPVLSIDQNTSQMLEQENANAQPSPSPIASPPLSPQTNAAETEVPETYVIQAGDNLLLISERFYGTRDMVDEIMAENDITDPDMIFFGQTLKMPQL